MNRLLTALCALLLAACNRSSPNVPSAPAAPPAPVVQDAGVASAREAPMDAGTPGPSREDAGAARCSASTLSPEPVPAQPPLPAVVDSMRRRIVAAAVACDYAALAVLAREKGEEFNFSFGPGEDPAAYWREREREGDAVLGRLVRLLNLPYAKDGTLYVWPSVFRMGAKAEDWKALEGFYPPEQLAQWRNLEEGYLGLRTGISENGDWLFAVAGD
ncbi:hypothetical protein ACN28I_43450 [Archangium gephyra]|uniref:hypothetical protein n=1 Tax=Archangium gephyra TaxID=48 RepID=UPI003B7E3699